MQVYKDIHHLPQFKHAVITIGTFDGVHSGHVKLIDKIKEKAKSIDGTSVLITFHPHPKNIIDPEFPVFILTTMNEKIDALSMHQVDHLVIIPFSREFSEIEAEDYIEHFLIKKFSPKVIVFGHDHKFGKNRSGDIETLKSIATKYAIEVKEIPPHMIDEITVSSSKIRKNLASGNIIEANHLLGYAYTLSGIVVKGDQIGRTLGFPTANLQLYDSLKLIPKEGVYLSRVKIKSDPTVYFGLLSIGKRPTFNKTEMRIEVNLLDFNRSIYGEEISISILQFIRPDKKYNSKDSLIDAMKEDKKSAQQIIQSNLF